MGNTAKMAASLVLVATSPFFYAFLLSEPRQKRQAVEQGYAPMPLREGGSKIEPVMPLLPWQLLPVRNCFPKRNRYTPDIRTQEKLRVIADGKR